jgi:hypothetical protein
MYDSNHLPLYITLGHLALLQVETRVVLNAPVGDPGYHGTAAIMTAVALTLLMERGTLRQQAGVHTVGTIMTGSGLQGRLQEAGISFVAGSLQECVQ